jgi:hypothetical protein
MRVSYARGFLRRILHLWAQDKRTCNGVSENLPHPLAFGADGPRPANLLVVFPFVEL